MNDGTTGQTVTLDFAAALALVTDGNPATVDTLTIDGDSFDTVTFTGTGVTSLGDAYDDGYNYYELTDGTDTVIVKVLIGVTVTP
jgi:hypothetical protein